MSSDRIHLRAESISLSFGGIQALINISFEVQDGEILAIIGPNGAGKTTTLKAISGLMRTLEGEVTRGSIEFGRVRIDHMMPEDIVDLGIIQVLEGRRLFQHLTVEENLILGGIARRKGTQCSSVHQDIEQVYHYLPHLEKLSKRTSGYFSGSEQQMLVI